MKDAAPRYRIGKVQKNAWSVSLSIISILRAYWNTLTVYFACCVPWCARVQQVELPTPYRYHFESTLTDGPGDTTRWFAGISRDNSTRHRLWKSWKACRSHWKLPQDGCSELRVVCMIEVRNIGQASSARGTLNFLGRNITHSKTMLSGPTRQPEWVRNGMTAILESQYWWLLAKL